MKSLNCLLLAALVAAGTPMAASADDAAAMARRLRDPKGD